MTGKPLNERLRYRLGLRSSNAAVPHRNKHREAKVNPPPEPETDSDEWFERLL